MKRALPIIVIVVVIVIVGAFLLTRNKSNNKTSSTNTTSSTYSGNMNMQTNSSSSSTNSQSPVATNKVNISNFAFSPSTITVAKGTNVTWTNHDSTTHTVNENDGKTGPNSGDLLTGESYSFVYATPGTYQYHCQIHPNMTGTVIVTD